LRVEALGGVTPLTNFIINTTAIAESKLNKKAPAYNKCFGCQHIIKNVTSDERN
jgi:hypothetical protein